MLHRTVLCLALGALLTGGLEGCTMMKSGSSTLLPSSAYFAADAGELPLLQVIAQAQDTRLKVATKARPVKRRTIPVGWSPCLKTVPMPFDCFRSCTRQCRRAAMTAPPLAG